MLSWLLLVLALTVPTSGFAPCVAHGRSSASSSISRNAASSVVMKGKGTRGMPGKGVRPPTGSGMQKSMKKRMAKRDFDNGEWTFVAAKEDLASECGATKAVEAGMSPNGQNYIWTIIRGDDGDGEGSTVYCTDGSCRACQFPTMNSNVEKAADGSLNMRCQSCGTIHSLEDGSPIEWLPGNGPIQWAAAQLNKAKQPEKVNLLMTRVSRSGRVYVRLPDGTLPMARTPEQRAAELADLQGGFGGSK